MRPTRSGQPPVGLPRRGQCRDGLPPPGRVTDPLVHALPVAHVEWERLGDLIELARDGPVLLEGLVEALDGAPGVHSARYAGEHATDEQRCMKLLQEMEGKTNRRAVFECAISIAVPTGKALTYETGFIVAVMAGVMTATAGGLVRDVLTNHVPLILQKEVYATACIIGGVVFYILHRMGASMNTSSVIAALTVLVIRIIAIHRNWSLPVAGGREDEH